MATTESIRSFARVSQPAEAGSRAHHVRAGNRQGADRQRIVPLADADAGVDQRGHHRAPDHRDRGAGAHQGRRLDAQRQAHRARHPAPAAAGLHPDDRRRERRGRRLDHPERRHRREKVPGARPARLRGEPGACLRIGEARRRVRGTPRLVRVAVHGGALQALGTLLLRHDLPASQPSPASVPRAAAATGSPLPSTPRPGSISPPRPSSPPAAPAGRERLGERQGVAVYRLVRRRIRASSTPWPATDVCSPSGHAWCNASAKETRMHSAFHIRSVIAFALLSAWSLVVTVRQRMAPGSRQIRARRSV